MINLKMSYSKKSIEADVLPCPFCGSTDNLQITDDEIYYKSYGEHGHATIALGCTKCHVSMYEFDYHENNYDQKVKFLIEKWNRRNGE